MGYCVDAFDAAWAILKEWSPDWRRRAAALPPIDENVDFGFDWGDSDAAEAARFGEESASVVPFIHPHNPSFVVKTPTIWGEIGPTERNLMRVRDNPFGTALEELGFPVVSEMRLNDTFNIQPRVITVTRQPEGEGYERWLKAAREPFNGRRRLGTDEPRTLQSLANRATDLFAMDRHTGNIGLDPKGMPRFFDYRLEPWYDAFDPRHGKTKKERAEEWMGETRLMGLELPISRMIDRLPDMTDIELENDEDSWDEAKDWRYQLNWDQDKLRELLELLEPHSRYGTKQVTVDGKAIWGDDW